jgi:hypothetical protein
LTKYYFGVIGPAIANLISFTVYNAIRYFFLLKRFNLQPFTAKTVYTIILGIATYYCCYFLLNDMHGLIAMIARSTLFLTLFIAGVFLLKLSPDVLPVWHSLQKRLGIKKGD